MEYHKPPFVLKEFKIEVTDQCNLACVHCSSNAGVHRSKFLEIGIVIRILKEAYELGARKISFSGGEPFLWLDLIEAINVGFKLGYDVSVYTTGNVPDFNRSICEIHNAGLARLIFSVYSSSDSIHESITRIRGSFANTIKSITYSVAANIETELHFVALKSNYKELENVVKMASRLGVSRTSVLRFVPQGRGALMGDELLNKIENLDLRKTVVDLRDRGYNIRTGSPFNFLMLNKQPKCSSAIDRCVIDSSLNVFPCDAFKNISSSDVVGTSANSNLYNASFPNVWDNSPYLNAIRQYLTTPFAIQCEQCSNLELCLSGCLAQKFLVHGQLKKISDPMCIKSR